MELYSYQKEYVNRKSTFDITNKSRQIGFSSCCIAVKSIDRCLAGYDQLLVSSSQRQSNKLMSYVETLLSHTLKKGKIKLLKDTTTQKI